MVTALTMAKRGNQHLRDGQHSAGALFPHVFRYGVPRELQVPVEAADAGGRGAAVLVA